MCSLASGSNGNAFFIKTGKDAFLVDVGISCRQICLRLEQIGHAIDEIKAIFITHEHWDHIMGLRVLLKRFPRPVYITEKTYEWVGISIDEDWLNLIEANDTVIINDTRIQSFPKSHDAADPSLFCFYYGDKKISMVTDIGYACKNVIEAVHDAQVILLESNYDETMLRDGFYPEYLKRRIAGIYGHLSNSHAGSLILEHASPCLEYVFLSHLSGNNNTPDTALSTVEAIVKEREDLKNMRILIASRDGVSEKIKLKPLPE